MSEQSESTQKPYLGPGLSYEEAKAQDPERFHRSQQAGGYAKAKVAPEPEWLHCDVGDFLKWLAAHE